MTLGEFSDGRNLPFFEGLQMTTKFISIQPMNPGYGLRQLIFMALIYIH